MKKSLYAILLLLLCAVRQEAVAQRKRVLSQDTYENAPSSAETSTSKAKPAKSEKKKKQKAEREDKSELSSEKCYSDEDVSQKSQKASARVKKDRAPRRVLSQDAYERAQASGPKRPKVKPRPVESEKRKKERAKKEARRKEAAKKEQARLSPEERRANAQAQIEPQKMLIEDQCKKADQADLKVKKLVRKVHKLEKKGFKAHRERLKKEDERKAARKEADALRIKERNLRSATQEAVEEAHHLDRKINNVLGYSVIEVQELEDAIREAKKEAAHEAKQARKAQHKLAHYYKEAGVLGRVPCCKPEHVVRREEKRAEKKQEREKERKRVYTERDKQKTQDAIEQYEDSIKQLKYDREAARYSEVTTINKEIKQQRMALKKARVKLVRIKESLTKQRCDAGDCYEKPLTRKERRCSYINKRSTQECLEQEKKAAERRSEKDRPVEHKERKKILRPVKEQMSRREWFEERQRRIKERQANNNDGTPGFTPLTRAQARQQFTNSGQNDDKNETSLQKTSHGMNERAMEDEEEESAKKERSMLELQERQEAAEVKKHENAIQRLEDERKTARYLEATKIDKKLKKEHKAMKKASNKWAETRRKLGMKRIIKPTWNPNRRMEARKSQMKNQKAMEDKDTSGCEY